MSSRIFMYRLKTIVRDKELVFWNLAFPLLLATLFTLAFANLGRVNAILPIPVGIVFTDSPQSTSSSVATSAVGGPAFAALAEDLADVLAMRRLDPGQAAAQLASDEIFAIVEEGSAGLRLLVRESGLRQSIVQSVLDQYLQTATAFGVIAMNAATPADPQQLQAALGRGPTYINAARAGRNELNQMLIFYFALMAMACFYGGYYGLLEVQDYQANQSTRAARINVAPVGKLRMFLASSGASLALHFVIQIVLLVFLTYVAKIDFGPRVALVLLASLTGCILSISLGAVIAAALPGSENFKSGIVTAVSMVGSLFAGLMITQLKYVVNENAPIINRLNPVNLLADAYYSLYYFEGYERYAGNVLSLLLMSLVCIVALFFLMRRKRYDSI